MHHESSVSFFLSLFRDKTFTIIYSRHESFIYAYFTFWNKVKPRNIRYAVYVQCYYRFN